jgi:hypothetical protein
MLTLFGIWCRKLRLDLGINLKGQADAFKYSEAFVSAIETGRKGIPPGYLEKLFAWAHVPQVAQREARRLAYLQSPVMSYRPKTQLHAHLAAAFLVQLEGASCAELAVFQHLLSVEEPPHIRQRASKSNTPRKSRGRVVATTENPPETVDALPGVKPFKVGDLPGFRR